MSNTLQTKTTLKGWFISGAVPTESNFNDLITTVVVEGGSTGSLNGAIQVGPSAIASAAGAVAIGNNVVASNISSVIIGTNAINDEINSLQVGDGIRILESEPSVLRNGDIWIDGSDIKARSNNISVNLSNTIDTLAYSANVNTDATTANIFRITLTGAVLLKNPTGGYDGQAITWWVKQGGAGSNTVTLDSKFNLPTSADPLAWSTTVGRIDILCARYDEVEDLWYVVSFVPGYNS